MRTIIFLFCLISSIHNSIGQFQNDLIVDRSKEYSIDNEDSLIQNFNEPHKITANLNFENCSNVSNMCQIKFSRAELKNDTLYIKIFDTNTVFNYEYLIKVINGKFQTSFNYQTTVDQSKRKLKDIKSALIINSDDIVKGREIRGYTEYKGKCINNCDTNNLDIIVKGCFKVKIE